jgi:hypothetical protein
MPQPPSPHRFGPLRLVLVFGLVSGLAGFVYEGARSIVSGRWSDRSGRYWAISHCRLRHNRRIGTPPRGGRAAGGGVPAGGGRALRQGGAHAGQLAGSATIGALYDVSVDDAIDFTVVVQAVAVLAFEPLWSTAADAG